MAWRAWIDLALKFLQAAATAVIAALAVWAWWSTPKFEEVVAELTKNLTATEKERNIYAETAVSEVIAKLVAIGESRLVTYEFFAELATKDFQHKEWMEKNYEFETLLNEYLAMSEKERSMNRGLKFDLKHLQRQAHFLPNIWIGEPVPPTLRPIGDPLGEPIAWGYAWEEANKIMKNTEKKIVGDFRHFDYKRINTWLRDYFLSHTVIQKGGKIETGETFVANLKIEPIVQGLLSDERSAVELLLDEFLKSNPELRAMEIKLAFPQEPTVQTFRVGGKRMLRNIQYFREKLGIFFSPQNSLRNQRWQE